MSIALTRTAIAGQVKALLSQLAAGKALRRSGAKWVFDDRKADSFAKAIPKPLIDFCLKENLVELLGDEIAISASGRLWLRRAEPGGDDDAFRAQHQLWVNVEREIEGTRVPVRVNDAESPLGWLRSRKDRNGRPLISDEQFDAGERLRADYWFARLSPRVTANWAGLAPARRLRRSAPSHDAAFSDNALAAKQRVINALAAVGPELAGILVDICCELHGLEEAEKTNGWPPRAGKVVLQLALTRLAKHYGIGREGGPAVRAGRVRHWGTDDYRPTLDAWRNSADQ